MIRRPRRSFIPSAHAAFAAASVALCALLSTMSGAAIAQASDAAAGASATVASGQRYAVKPGQSLNDVAGEITGSKERAVKEKMARALFDANPNAFAGHDINRLKLGAVLNVPASEAGGASDAQAAASAVQASAPEPASQGTTGAASESTPSASAVESASGVQQASEAQPPATPAVAPAASAPAPESVPARRVGPDPMLFGLAIAVLLLLFLLMMWRSAKRRRAKAEAEARRHERVPASAVYPPATGAADLEGDAVPRDQSELNAVAASMESYEAAQSFAAPSDDDAAPSAKAPLDAPSEAEAAPEAPEAAETQANDRDRAEPPAPFMPAAPAALHSAFMPPRPVEMSEADAQQPQEREIAGREAEKWEAEERQAAARQAAAREAEEREIRAREAAARDALARETAGREGEAREAAEQEAQAQQAREAAAREIIAREAELRQAQAHAHEEHAEDDEPTQGDRFPMPKFPTEAVQALDSLDLGLPPRMELKLNSPLDSGATPPLHESQTPIEPVPFVPQPVAETDAAQQSKADIAPPSAAAQIEAGTAGAASVAGLGARLGPTQFGPLSLDFDLDLPSSQTEPLPALTPAQLATIARNKLELAVEYIELGDLGGARTLLQEVIASNDTATRQKAAALLSTLAPHS
ncbi:FimV/HubP family polar landmark protein [Caballeronia sp. ATUFL_M2_KS44]|uniref:FimV/HubP family polar landmark protein n=1 Tax=Caballeronia sp. ATUFL_M2_KS44 TaxID=2921767 RepID=UPI002029744B|nr:FimV/HubP family polar landmark protein [Caballeronia sp. ATUFL_M2_KS44]